MASRSVEDRLREQYFDLFPRMARVAEELRTTIEFAILTLRRDLTPHENLAVKVRIKDCVSAIDKLRQFNPVDPSAERNPGGVFDQDLPDKYNLLSLRDLVGARVLVFPSRRAVEVERLLRMEFHNWFPDPIIDGGQQLAFKYNGTSSDHAIPCEYQIVSTLIGLFWEVEHAAIYKQTPGMKGSARLMRDHQLAVYQALKSFEEEFERRLEESESS